MKTLFIVESPTKAKSINKMLDSSFVVLHTSGHICDIKNTFNLNKEKIESWDLDYFLLPSGKDLIKKIKEVKNDVKEVILATDFDREGEIISFNIKSFIKKYLKNETKFSRIILREITKPSLLFGIENSIEIDQNLVSSQETRRILDKMIGYTLSPIANKFLSNNNNSVGRVQSVALFLIADRTKENKNFVPEPVYEMKIMNDNFSTKLFFKNKKVFDSEKELENLVQLSPKEFFLDKTSSSINKLKQNLPLKTSTLQKLCFSLYKLSPFQTMFAAQKLFEGKEIENKIVGIISYPRTDSIRINKDFLDMTKIYLKNNYNVTKFSNLTSVSKKQLNIQDAHECIRPLDITLLPKDVEKFLEINEYKVYNAIYYSFLSSCFLPSEVEKTKFFYKNKDYNFVLENHDIVQPGCFVVEKCKEMFCTIPKKIIFSEKKMIVKVEKNISFTKPKALYDEIGLINVLEKNGIGRPSTYSSILPKLLEKNYVIKENNRISSTEKGNMLSFELRNYFSNILDLKFTQKMEEKLHDISLEKIKKEIFLNDFVNNLSPCLETFNKHIGYLKKEGKIINNYFCSICNTKCRIFFGSYGPFAKCDNNHNTSLENKHNIENMDGSEIKNKKSKYNRLFFIDEKIKGIFYLSPDKKCFSLEGRKFTLFENEKIKDIEVIDSHCSYLVW